MAEDPASAAGSGPYNGRIIAREDLTPTVATFHVALDTAPVPFEAGQYIAIGLELSRGLVQRPYSIASSARRLEDGYELYIRKVPGGALTPSLFATGVGQRLLVRRPKGRFVLGRDDQRTHLFVATGCGLAPFLAMVRTLLDDGRPRRVVLLHGVSYVAELGYRALLEDWERSGALPRTEAQGLGIRVVLCVLDASREELLRRLAARNADLPAGTFRIDEAQLDRALRWFERPAASELALFDDAITYDPTDS